MKLSDTQVVLSLTEGGLQRLSFEYLDLDMLGMTPSAKRQSPESDDRVLLALRGSSCPWP